MLLCNNPDRQNIYSAALGLYNSRIVKLINKKGQLKSAVIIDELPISAISSVVTGLPTVTDCGSPLHGPARQKASLLHSHQYKSFSAGIT
jgi:hypothetical protein